MSIKCRIWFDTQLDAYVVTSTYSKELEKFVDTIKQFIPTGSRDYDPQKHFWYIKEQYAQFVRTLAEKTYGVGSVSFTSKQVAQKSQQSQRSFVSSSTTPLQATMASFVELLPYDSAKKAYLTACQILHPDKPTGDAEKMSRLNEVWERLEKELFKR